MKRLWIVFVVELIVIVWLASWAGCAVDEDDGGEQGSLELRWPALTCRGVSWMSLEVEAYSGAVRRVPVVCEEHGALVDELRWGSYWVRLLVAREGDRFCQERRVLAVDGDVAARFALQCAP